MTTEATIMPAAKTDRLEAPADAAERWSAYKWHLIPAVPTHPYLNMALDEVLTKRVARGDRPPTIRIWGWDRKAIVLGRFQSVRNEINEDVAREEDITPTRRITGGGAMFIEPEGAITWSIFAPDEIVQGLSFPESYAFFDGFVVDALRARGVDAWYAPINDITSAGGKIGGAAQARRNGAVLHHTTMAYAMNTSLMARVLRIGKEKLSDKGVKSAEKRVSPLAAQTQLSRDDLLEHIVQHFADSYGLSELDVTPEELAEAEELVRTKFGTKEWIYFLP